MSLRSVRERESSCENEVRRRRPSLQIHSIAYYMDAMIDGRGASFEACISPMQTLRLFLLLLETSLLNFISLARKRMKDRKLQLNLKPWLKEPPKT